MKSDAIFKGKIIVTWRKNTDSSHPEALVQSNPFVTWHKALLDKGIQVSSNEILHKLGTKRPLIATL